jgi:hypothetical protein
MLANICSFNLYYQITIIFFPFFYSVTKIRILDASAPLGLPVLLKGASNTKVATAISALSFSPDGEIVYILLFFLHFFVVFSYVFFIKALFPELGFGGLL